MSATHYDEATGEGAKIGWIDRVRNARAIGYATKYLLKAVAMPERGTRQAKRMRSVLVEDTLGELHFEREEVIEDVVSKARRIRYSRHFFPERVAVLREKLFNGMEEQSMEQCGAAQEGATAQEQLNNGLP
jgi:hypothetical protein